MIPQYLGRTDLEDTNFNNVEIKNGIWKVDDKLFIIAFDRSNRFEPYDSIDYIKRFHLEKRDRTMEYDQVNILGMTTHIKTDYIIYVSGYLHTNNVKTIDFSNAELIFDYTVLSNNEMRQLYEMSL